MGAPALTAATMTCINSNMSPPLTLRNHKPAVSSFPFHNLSLDCMNTILKYHIFHIQQGDLQLDGIGTLNWNFLRKFAHCCCSYGNVGLKEFLSACRDWHCKPTFSYLKLKSSTASHLLNSGAVEYLRGIPELDLMDLIADTQDLDLLFLNIRGVKKLSIMGIVNCDSKIQITTQHLENLRGIQEALFDICDFHSIADDAFENLRGIRSLTFAYCALKPSMQLLVNLRGVKELAISECESVPLSTEDLKDIRGVKSFIYSNSNDYGFIADEFVMTDQDFKHLRGIERLELWKGSDVEISNCAFKNLRGVQKLVISGSYMTNITDSAMVNLRGVKDIYLERFSKLTSAAMENLRGSKVTIKNCQGIRNSTQQL